MIYEVKAIKLSESNNLTTSRLYLEYESERSDNHECELGGKSGKAPNTFHYLSLIQT
jgi:hypothetical protein